MMVLLLIMTVGMILFGYLFMWRIDNFLGRGGIIDSPQGRTNRGVLLYGAPEVSRKITEAGIKCKTLTDLAFPEDEYYSALFALSWDDDKNLTICHAAKHADPGILVIARCNLPELSGVYEAAGVNKLLNAGEPIEELLTKLWGI